MEHHRFISPEISFQRKVNLLGEAERYVKTYHELKHDPDPENPYENPPWPTFTELSKLILKDKAWDEHWVSYEELCLPCDIKYTAVGRTETLNRDIAYILRKSGLGITGWPEDLNTSEGRKTSEIWKDYFKQLPKELLKMYEDYYEKDCFIFGFDCDTSNI